MNFFKSLNQYSGMKLSLAFFVLLIGSATTAFSQKLTVQSPDQKINVALYSVQNGDAGEWFLKASYVNAGKSSEAIPRIDLGLSRSDQDFAKELKFLKAGKPVLINEQYTALHGKKSTCSNSANEVIISFENPSKAKLNIIVRAYNDGIAFRYEFPEKSGSFVMKDEMTSYTIPRETLRWMERWNTANEGLYTSMSDDKIQKQEWCYPALFKVKDSACWFLLHESDVDRNYCGTKLSNTADSSKYKLTFPNPRDGRGQGESTPTVTLPWKSPWRVIIMGSLSDVVASTLVNDVATPSVVKNTSWIKNLVDLGKSMLLFSCAL